MRRLKTKDIFPIARMLKKVNLKDLPKTDNQVEIGMYILDQVLSSLDLIEKDLITWLASLTGRTYSEIEEMSLPELKEMIVEIGQQEDIKSFFVSGWSLAPKLPESKTLS